jgi:dihydroorotate dehydrogenase
MDLSRLALPLLRTLDPERAHALTLRALALGLAPVQRGADDPGLGIRAFGLAFPNPVGLAAGFDKNAAVHRPILRMGFGFAEVGSVTPRRQSGNPKPRIFRLAEDQAIINRLGFNNAGMEVVAGNLAGRRGGIVGVNIGRNKDTADPVADYVAGARRLGPLADYLVVNVSSPNTPGLRALQDRQALGDLVAAVAAALAEVCPDGPPPLLVKIAPDLTEEDRAGIAEAALSGPVAGLVIGNTTTGRPAGLAGAHRAQAGGLSGRPLFEPSTAVLADMYRLTEGRLPLVGVGGVASGADAYAKIRAGASLIQLYTALVFQGPGLLARIKRDLAGLLRADGFKSVTEAVGADIW